MGRPDWHVTMRNIYLLNLLLMYRPGQAAVKDNVRAYRLVGKMVIIKMACVSEDLKC